MPAFHLYAPPQLWQQNRRRYRDMIKEGVESESRSYATPKPKHSDTEVRVRKVGTTSEGACQEESSEVSGYDWYRRYMMLRTQRR